MSAIKLVHLVSRKLFRIIRDFYKVQIFNETVDYSSFFSLEILKALLHLVRKTITYRIRTFYYELFGKFGNLIEIVRFL